MLRPERSKRSVLGIALGERAALIAEAKANGKGRLVGTTIEFRYPAGVTLESGEVLGQSFRAFLRERQLSATCAVVGVPAKWLISSAHVIPPADAETAARVIRMRAEAEGGPELGEMVFDYSGDVGAARASSICLCGLPRRWLDRVTAVATGAGLRLLAVTPTAGVLTPAPDSGRSTLLSVRPDEVELVTREGGCIAFVRHLGAGGATAPWLAELRRAVAFVPGGAIASVALWDDVGLETPVIEAIAAAVGAPVERAGSAAGALALTGSARERLALDFLRPKVVAPKVRRFTRRAVWYAAASVAVVLGATLAYSDLADAERAVAQSNDELKQLEPALKLAKPFVADMEFAESFKAGKPRYLACLADLTEVMPADGQAYLATFSLHADLKGEFGGRATSNQEVLNLMDRLNASGRFVDLRRRLDGRGTGTEVSFHVTFRYVPRA